MPKALQRETEGKLVQCTLLRSKNSMLNKSGLTTKAESQTKRESRRLENANLLDILRNAMLICTIEQRVSKRCYNKMK